MKPAVFLFLLFHFLSRSSTAQWEQIGLPDHDVSVVRSIGDSLFAGGSRGTVFVSVDNGTSWATIATMNSAFFEEIVLTDSGLLAGFGHACGACFEFACIFLSTDHGRTWDSVFSGLYGTGVIASYGGLSFSYVDNNFVRSNDGGLSWVTISGIYYVQAITAGKSGVFYSTYPSGLFRSLDNGVTWTELEFEPEITWHLGSSGGAVLASTDHLIHRSFDAGETWETLANPLPDATSIFGFVPHGMYMFSLVHDYLGDYRVLVTSDQTDDWVDVSEGLDLGAFEHVMEIEFHRDYLFLATTRGVWGRPVSEIVSVNEVPFDLPLSFSLHQNYPNPFNPTTTIPYSLSSSGDVRLTIFTLLGEKITTLISGHREPGTHTVTWDASGQPSGVYFYRLEAGDFIQTKKLVLVR